MKLRPNAVESKLRCSYCHSDDGKLEECSGCLTLLHGCQAEGCPTLKCPRHRRWSPSLAGMGGGNVVLTGGTGGTTGAGGAVAIQGGIGATARRETHFDTEAMQVGRDTNLAGAGNLPRGNTTLWFEWRAGVRAMDANARVAGIQMDVATPFVEGAPLERREPTVGMDAHDEQF